MNGSARKDTLTEDHSSLNQHGLTPLEDIALAFLACWLIVSGAIAMAWRKITGH